MYRVMLALTDLSGLEDWIRVASTLPKIETEIVLRGLLVMPEGVSLSEGTLPAREMRDRLDKAARDSDIISDETIVHVDYRPMTLLLEDLRANPVDLLMVGWAGPLEPTGGLSTDDILNNTPCDLILLYGDSWRNPGPVMISLRGGPNLSLGIRLANALANGHPLTLFHAADLLKSVPALAPLMRAESSIKRLVTTVSDIASGIVKEAEGHNAIVLGASSRHSDNITESGSVVRSVFEKTKVPMAIVRSRRPEPLDFHIPAELLHEDSLSMRVDRWFAQNTYHSNEFSDIASLMAIKERQGVTIGLALPALNEGETVGKVITTIKSALMDEYPLLDEIVLIDSNSTDDTVAIAESLGVRTYKHPDILPEEGSYRGKGEALWKSLHVLTTDIIAWIDTDITNIHPRFIYGLIGPMLKRPNVQYVKGFYQRPIKVGDQLQAYGGGRVTELVARPLLNLFYPELSGIIQPLSGEYAGRRAALDSTPFFTGYGVETGLLIDLHEKYGLEGIAQVDLEERVHHNQPLVNLSKMSFAILQVFISRLERRYGMELLDKANRSMKLIIHEPERFALDIAEISDIERPAMNTIKAYMERLNAV
jgi:glucosyl-3-phosphoglycerate synthase